MIDNRVELDVDAGHWEHAYTRTLRQTAHVLGLDDTVSVRLFFAVLQETGAILVTPISQIWPSVLIG